MAYRVISTIDITINKIVPIQGIDMDIRKWYPKMVPI